MATKNTKRREKGGGLARTGRRRFFPSSDLLFVSFRVFRGHPLLQAPRPPVPRPRRLPEGPSSPHSRTGPAIRRSSSHLCCRRITSRSPSPAATGKHASTASASVNSTPLSGSKRTTHPPPCSRRQL